MKHCEVASAVQKVVLRVMLGGQLEGYIEQIRILFLIFLLRFPSKFKGNMIPFFKYLKRAYTCLLLVLSAR